MGVREKRGYHSQRRACGQSGIWARVSLYRFAGARDCQGFFTTEARRFRRDSQRVFKISLRCLCEVSASLR
jgi:hypothetical protein